MTLLADLTIRSSAIVLLGLGANALLGRRSAALRHAVLAFAMLAAAVSGPLTLLLPAWEVPVFRAGASARPEESVSTPAIAVTAAAPVSQPGPVSLSRAAIAVWGAGAALSLVVLLTSLHRVRRISKRSPPARDDQWTRMSDEIAAAYRLRRHVDIHHTNAPDLLASFGLWRPRVLLPAQAREWNAERVRVVLSHELTHIRRHDWVVQMGGELLRCAYWFNPLIWIACAGLRRECEQACDDAVLSAGIRPPDYAAHLLDLARTCRRPGPAWTATTPMARSSTLERRFSAMLNPALDRRPLSLRAVALTAAMLLAVTIPAAALRAGQAGPLPLTGVVYDTSGAVLPGVELTVEDARKNTWRAVTDASGQFEFPALAPGGYVISAAVPGFRALRHDFELKQERDWDRAITLQVGDIKESISVKSQRSSGSPVPSASVGPQRVRVGGNIRAPRKLHDVHPVYPQSMREAGREGVVPIEAIIGRDGLVHSVRVLSANIHPDFAVAAADAVRAWRFAPTLLNGAPVEVSMTVTVSFSLSD